MYRQPRASVTAAAILMCTAVDLAADAPVTRQGAEEVGDTVVPYVFDGDVRGLPTSPEWRPGDAMREIPRRHASPPAFRAPFNSSSDPDVADPLVDRQRQAPLAQPLAFGVPSLNIPGQSFSGHPAPDTVGDVGPGHFIQASS